MPKPSPLGEQIEFAFSRDPRFKVHPADHCDYLLRYRTATGRSFAIGRTTATGPRFWVLQDESFRRLAEAEGFACTLSLPKPKSPASKGTGRNSNLNAISEFKGAPLYWVTVNTVGEALSMAGKLI